MTQLHPWVWRGSTGLCSGRGKFGQGELGAGAHWCPRASGASGPSVRGPAWGRFLPWPPVWVFLTQHTEVMCCFLCFQGNVHLRLLPEWGLSLDLEPREGQLLRVWYLSGRGPQPFQTCEARPSGTPGHSWPVVWCRVNSTAGAPRVGVVTQGPGREVLSHHARCWLCWGWGAASPAPSGAERPVTWDRWGWTVLGHFLTWDDLWIPR